MVPEKIMKSLKELAELGYLTAISHEESYSKDIFWNILSELNRLEALQQHNTPGRAMYQKIDNKEDMLVVAYFLSKYEHTELFPKDNLTQKEAIDKIASIIGVNRNTLKNQRDRFDSFTGSHRVGWKEPLNAKEEEVFKSLGALPKEKY